METLLFLAHTESDGSLGKASLEALGGAKALAGALGEAQLVAGLIGETVQPAADALGGCGTAKFLGVTGAEFGVSRYATDAAAVEALCKAAGATLVVAAGTSRFARVLPGVAFRLDGRADTHVTGLGAENGTPVASRWFYRQRMIARLTRPQRPWFLVVDPGSQAPWQGEAGSATVEAVAVDLPDTVKRTRVEGIQSPPADAQTIRPEAELLFVAGAGWTKKQPDGQPHVDQAKELILNFLNASKASLGGSKSIVDLSGEGQAVLPFMTHLNQVGQTGATPRHPKGLATCCHGEEPHVVGWRFINERRAVNLDPNCGWAQGKADVLYVADAFAVMQKVNELLGQ
jgi:electron transfer flavoprotein alpha subunit